MYAKLEKIPKTILTLLYGVVLVWVLLLGYEWGKTYFENQQKSAYKEVPFELKLKAKPEDVIYSQAYKTPSGIDEVKYAYLTEEVLPIPNEDISRRTPASQTEVLEKYKDENGKPMEKLHTTFVSKPQFYKISGTWRQIEYATTTAEVFSMSGAIPYIQRRELAERVIPGDTVFGATSTFYPDPNVETNSVDGYIGCTDSASNLWSTCHDATAGDISDDSSTILYLEASFTRGVGDTCPPFGCTPPDTYAIYRVFLLFNTASLPDNSTITATTLSIYVSSKTTTNSDTIELVTSTPASNTGLIVGDFDQISTVQQASGISISSLTASAYNAFTLNATGKGNVNLTGVTKFAIRTGQDRSNTAPGTEGSDNVGASSADVSGTSQDPKLDVTYTLPGGFSVGNWFPF